MSGDAWDARLHHTRRWDCPLRVVYRPYHSIDLVLSLRVIQAGSYPPHVSVAGGGIIIAENAAWVRSWNPRVVLLGHGKNFVD